MANVLGGYQPDTRSESARRADFDLRRRIVTLEEALAAGGGGGGAGGAGYVHNQSVAAPTWTVDHNLGYRPNVTVEDSAGTTIEGEIVHNSAIQLTLTFSAAFTGVAYCS